MAIVSNKKGVEYVRWFSELNKDSGKVAGGKGANLAEIFNIGVNVPAGFVITAQAYDHFIREAGLNKQISEILKTIDYEDTKGLDTATEKIRGLIVEAEFPESMKSEVLEAYDSLNVNGFDFEKGSALAILNSSNEPPFVAVRSSSTAEDLAEASFAGQQDSYVNIKGNVSLIIHVKKCFASLYTSRATYYRNKQGFKHEDTHLAVVIQMMVDSDKSGVMFSKDPTSGEDNIDVEAVWGLGEGIVSGKITPDKYIVSRDFKILDKIIANKKIAITRNSAGDKIEVKLVEERAKAQVLKNHEIKKLAEMAIRLEKHYNKPQDIEFAIEGADIFIVQTRPITTMAKKSEIDAELKIKGEPEVEGMPASPGIASGKVKLIADNKDLEEVEKGDVLVTKMTDPDMVVAMQKATAIVTDEGGATSHAAIVSREMGTPCVVGTQDATEKLKEDEIVTVDGTHGKVYKGKVAEDSKKKVLPVEKKTKTKIKVMVDLPTYADRAAKSGVSHVGLTRIEGIIAEGGKHPNYFLLNKNIEDYEKLIYDGISGIAKYFDGMWVRTSDIRSDEFAELEGAPKRDEANPMLGMHGIRYSLAHPSVLKAELKALKKVASTGKEIGVLLPQIISVDEVRAVKTMLKEIDFHSAKIGVMVETPAAVQIISDLCKEGIDFISFGTNDLTQYILAVDRGNELVQDIYDEMHPAVLSQLAYVIRACKKSGVTTSICGQAGSKKEMVKFLVKHKIDSISVNADMAKEISDYVYELENKRGEDLGEEVAEVKKAVPVVAPVGVPAPEVEGAPTGVPTSEDEGEEKKEEAAVEKEVHVKKDNIPVREDVVVEKVEFKPEPCKDVVGVQVDNKKKEDVDLVSNVEEKVEDSKKIALAEERMDEIQREIIELNNSMEKSPEDNLEIENVEGVSEESLNDVVGLEAEDEVLSNIDVVENVDEEEYDESNAIDASSAEDLIGGVSDNSKKDSKIEEEIEKISDELDIY